MKTDKTDESAFPSTFKSLDPETGHVHRWGMTLRDYFAAAAMAAYVQGSGYPHESMEVFAEIAYAQADAMLEARKK